PSELQSVGSMVTYSVDVNLAAVGSPQGYTFFFSPATSPFTTGQDYTQSLGFTIDWAADAPGTISVWPNSGATTTPVGTITPRVLHSTSRTMTRTSASAINYTVQSCGVGSFGSTFTNTDPRGITASEMYIQQGTGNNGLLVDNLNMTAVPEPA